MINNSETFVQWDVEDYDVGSLHDNVTNKNRVTIPTSGTVSGLWLMQAQGEWAAGTTGYRFLGIQKGGGLYGAYDRRGTTPTLSPAHSVVTVVTDPANGDWFQVGVQHTQGVALNLMGGQQTVFSVAHMG